MTSPRMFLSLLAACATFHAHAADSDRAAATQIIKVTNAWVRAPAPGQKTAAAYMDLTSARDLALVAAGSAAAARIEMHEMTTEGGVMRMRPLPRVDLRSGSTVKFAPGGMHLMLVDVKKPLKPGDKVPLTLSFQGTGASAGTPLTTLRLDIEVRAAAAAAPHSH